MNNITHKVFNVSFEYSLQTWCLLRIYQLFIFGTANFNLHLWPQEKLFLRQIWVAFFFVDCHLYSKLNKTYKIPGGFLLFLFFLLFLWPFLFFLFLLLFLLSFGSTRLRVRTGSFRFRRIFFRLFHLLLFLCLMNERKSCVYLWTCWGITLGLC